MAFKLSRNSSGLSGEYFVAAELYRRGFSVGMTIGNAKAIDILAEKEGKTHIIQVKSIINRKSSGWPIWKKSVKRNVVYIFVNLNTKVDMEYNSPDYYICKHSEVTPKIKEYKTRAILDIGSLKKESSKFLDRWDKIK